MYGQHYLTATTTTAASLPALYNTAYHLWWIVMTFTLIAAAAALWRLTPRKTR